MAIDFNDATPDGLSYTLDAAQSNLDEITVASWLYPDKTDQYGRHFHLSNATNDDDSLLMNFDNAWGFVVRASWSTTDGVWSITKPSTGAWVHIAFTYSFSATTNDAIIYQNGVSQSITERSTPVGTKKNAFSRMKLACNDPWTTSITLGSYNGRMAEFAIWNRVLSADEILGLGKGLAPSFYQRGLVFYDDLNGTSLTEGDKIKNVTASTVGSPVKIDHPRIIYPEDELWIPNASATAATLEQHSFRFRADDGNESAATYLAALNTNITRAKNVNTRLRFLVNATGNPDAKQFRLEYRKVGDTDWNIVE